MAAHAATNLSSPTSQTFGRSATSDFSSSSQCDHRDPSDQQLPADVNPGEKRKRDDPDLTGDQDPSPHPLWKTSLCSYFRSKSGVCSHGTACRYAHGDEELRPRPDNSWDPTSERAKKLLKSESGKENDDFGLEGERVMMTDAFADGGDDFILSKCLVHLPKRWSSEELRGFLSEQGISFKSAKKKKGMTVGFVSFKNAEQVCHAMEEMESKSINNKNVKVADIIPRSFEKKMNGVTSFTQQTTSSALDSSGVEFPISMNASVNGASADENSVMGGSVSGTRTARTVVTPLAHLLYNEQLEHKKNSVAHFLKKLTRNVRKACSNGVPLPEWICKSKEIGGLPCKLEGILESPCVRGYRNKCEFSVGYSLQGRPTVGFNLGNFREGVTAVEEPVDCPNVSGIAQKYALIFQDFLQHSSLPIWNRLNNTGFWRQLTVREGREPGKATEFEISDANIAEVMLIVQVCTNGVDDELLNLEFERMAQSFATGASTNFPCLPLTALVVQDHKGISNAAPAIAPLWSVAIPRAGDFEFGSSKNVEEARIHDYISGLKFCISPTAFFQVNTFAAEKLYSLAGDWARLCPDTLLFDICCGTGTIGLTLAHRVGMVVGIEMNASAVSDAQRNAEINGIENCRFINAKAEDVMGSLLKQYVNFHQEDEIADLSQSEDKEIIVTEDRESTDNVLLLEGSSNHEHEDGVDGSLQRPIVPEEPDDKLKKNDPSDSGIASKQQFKDVVAIVDPPRAGLHPTVLKVLRTNPHLRRLVYISCNPESLVANAIELCTPSANKTEKGNKNNWGWRNMHSAGLARHRVKSMPNSEPFRPVKAMAVDLFPHTPHCEMVMLLER